MEDNKEVLKHYKQLVLDPVAKVLDVEATASVRQQHNQVADSCNNNGTVPWSLDWLSKLLAKEAGNNLPFHPGVNDVKVSIKAK